MLKSERLKLEDAGCSALFMFYERRLWCLMAGAIGIPTLPMYRRHMIEPAAPAVAPYRAAQGYWGHVSNRAGCMTPQTLEYPLIRFGEYQPFGEAAVQ